MTKHFFLENFLRSSLDDAIDEMISTKIDRGLLYEIKRFHSDNPVSVILDQIVIHSID